METSRKQSVWWPQPREWQRKDLFWTFHSEARSLPQASNLAAQSHMCSPAKRGSWCRLPEVGGGTTCEPCRHPAPAAPGPGVPQAATGAGQRPSTRSRASGQGFRAPNTPASSRETKRGREKGRNVSTFTSTRPRAAVRPMQEVLIPVRAHFVCLGEHRAHSPNSENSGPRAEIAGRMRLCVPSPHMA